MNHFQKTIARMLACADLDVSLKEISGMSDEDFRALLMRDLKKRFPDLTPEIYNKVLAYYAENPSSLTLKDHIGWYFESKEILDDKEGFQELAERIWEFQHGNEEICLSVLNRDLWPPHRFEKFPEAAKINLLK